MTSSGFQVMESEPLGPHGVPSAAFKQKLGASRQDHVFDIITRKQIVTSEYDHLVSETNKHEMYLLYCKHCILNFHNNSLLQ